MVAVTLQCAAEQLEHCYSLLFLFINLFSYYCLCLIQNANCSVCLKGCLEDRWIWLAGLGERAAGDMAV